MQARLTPHGAVGAPSPNGAALLAARRAERRAWVVLLVAFCTWCGLVYAAVSALLQYRESASEAHRAGITVTRGLVSYVLPTETEPRLMTREHLEVLEGARVQTGPNAEATIALFDGSLVRLHSDTSIRLNSMRSGKFENSSTRLDLRLESGSAWLDVTGTLPHGGIAVALGEGQVTLQAGEYALWAEPEQARVSVYQGAARLNWSARRAVVAEGQRVVVRPGQPLEVLPLEEELLVNGRFTQGMRGWRTLDDLEVKSDSLGQRSLVPVEFDGQSFNALRVTRSTAIDRHNKTGLIQDINRSVRGLRSLTLRAKVKLLSAKLDGGGFSGTEYPMTFVVYYVDDRGGEPNWMHGFYFKNAENRPAQFGELIPQDTWRTYEVELMKQPDRPAFIKSLWVYAAGHDFDAMVADIQLIAR